MASAISIGNSRRTDLWAVLRSSTEKGYLLMVPAGASRTLRMEEGESVTSYFFDSREAAESSIGDGERSRFEEYHESTRR